MVVSKYPSVVTLPDNQKFKLIIDFLEERFKPIKKKEWIWRIDEGLVLNCDMERITLESHYKSLEKIFYYKVVESEPEIPFKEKIVFEDKNFLIVCKPHFLPVIPSGNYLNECLLYRLRTKTGNHDLSPVNRIDKDTAGLVMISKCVENRGIYQSLFMDRVVKKEYEAVVKIEKPVNNNKWKIESRIIKGEPFFRMKSVPGEINAITGIEVKATKENKAVLRLNPVTGKKHQLRVHLADAGLPIVNERFYPTLLPQLIDFEKPLQLISRKLSFKDPVTLKNCCFTSKRSLKEFW
ncbi:MAG: pseudouridine synthase [Desulfobacterales bacterium]|nr:pseudouridine synthase [Desulfobacterales bacterium]